MDRSATAEEVIRASRRLARTLGTRLDRAVEDLGVTYAQLELLELIERDHNAHAAELARSLDVTRQGVASLLSRLVLADLVDRYALDHGVQVPMLTEQGRRRIVLASDAVAKVHAQILSVPAHERAAFVGAAQSLASELRRRDPLPWFTD
jgi:DNA-binding MarR family transcriptional regulator